MGNWWSARRWDGKRMLSLLEYFGWLAITSTFIGSA